MIVQFYLAFLKKVRTVIVEPLPLEHFRLVLSFAPEVEEWSRERAILEVCSCLLCFFGRVGFCLQRRPKLWP